ncbi:MAG: deoxyguanosinetriphosphate triphosphohydrolase [Acidobacteriota bacterium]
MDATIREMMEEREAATLSEKATLSSRTKGRERDEPLCPIRTAFQRDRDRILHCKSFRRLKHKTQVFLSPEGDHYRTRLTHTLEVTQIARTISRALQLNEDLTEAIGLGHDLGHTPFGHAGESILNDLLPEGFRHFEQSLRIVEKLEMDGRGLNLTWEVRDGILKHSKGAGAVFTKQDKGRPATLEGQVVRVSDIIAYVNHDIDDALRSGLIKIDDIPSGLIEVLGATHSQRINTLVSDVIAQSQAAALETITMSPPVLQAMLDLRHFLYQSVYALSIPRKELIKAKKILSDIYYHLLENHDSLLPKFKPQALTIEQAAADFMAGMTDRFALSLYQTLFFPKAWHGL